MPPDVVHLDLYRVFEAVARLGNVTAAAEELLLSQPAVSQKIRQLENDLGCSLFVRTSRGVHVTAEGEVLYRYAAEGLERFRLGERKLKELLDLDSGEIRVGASDMTLQFCLLPYLEKFHARYPGVKISVTNGPRRRPSGSWNRGSSISASSRKPGPPPMRLPGTAPAESLRKARLTAASPWGRFGTFSWPGPASAPLQPPRSPSGSWSGCP